MARGRRHGIIDPMRRTMTALTAVSVLAALTTACGDDSSSNETAADSSTNTTLTRRVDGIEVGEDCEIMPLQAPPDASQTPPDCGEPEPEPEPEPQLGTGDVQITLRWESEADLDLHVIEPDGTEISYTNRGPTSTGGQLDVDSNVGCEPEASVENVFWPEGQMPEGDYTVEVHGFSVDGCGSGDYTLTVKVEGEQILDETGSVGHQEEDTYDFSV